MGCCIFMQLGKAHLHVVRHYKMHNYVQEKTEAYLLVASPMLYITPFPSEPNRTDDMNNKQVSI